MLFGAEAVCTEAITLGCSEPGGYCCVPPAAVKFNTECSVWPSVMVNAKLYLQQRNGSLWTVEAGIRWLG